jgi:FkbM family methyltransferase
MNKYSQFGEEEIIQSYFDKHYMGGCIDVGASNGIFMNNTKIFEDAGWYCLCIEPNPKYYEELIVNRQHGVNYAIDNRNDDLIFKVVTAFNAEEQDLGQYGISALRIDEKLVESFKNSGLHITIKPILVKAITLDTCIRQYYKYDRIDFISIDTEGTELDVLRGFSIEDWWPKLFVIENNFNDPEIEEYLKPYGYEKVNRLEVNDFYLRVK